MENVVLVDSTVFIALLREGRDPAVELLQRTNLDDLATCGLVRMEVVRGLKVPKVKTRIAEFFDVLQNVPTDNRIWEDAAELAWQLDRTGITLPAQDILIAACARQLGAAVLTFDKHFAMIPKVRVYQSIDELR